MTPLPEDSLTIGRPAKSADIGVETIRYGQERALELGFSLDEVADARLRRRRRLPLGRPHPGCEHTGAGRPCPIIGSLSVARS